MWYQGFSLQHVHPANLKLLLVNSIAMPWRHLVLAECMQVLPGGIVTDPSVHQNLIHCVVSGIEAQGFISQGTVTSPVRGALRGNIEFLACFIYQTCTEG